MSKKRDGEMGARADKKVGKKASSGVNAKENVYRGKPKVGARGDVREEKMQKAQDEKAKDKKREILKLVVLLVISVVVPILFVGASGDGCERLL